MTTRLHRTLAVATAPALALTVLGAFPAHAAAPGVTKADLPSTAQVAKIYPDLKKAKSESTPSRAVAETKSCTQQGLLKAKRGRETAWYAETSKQVVVVQVADMKSTAQAKRVLRGVRVENKCGTVDIDGGWKSRRITVPKLGNESAGQAIVLTGADAAGEGVLIAFRKKNRIVQVQVFHEGKANVARARKLAKTAYKAAL